MPTYGYRCPACATEFDVLQRMTDDSLAHCPQCGAAATRQFFPAGIVFKGAGFYATDSRSASGSDGAGGSGRKDGASPSKSDAPAAPSAGSKPSTAEPAKPSDSAAPSGTTT